MGLAARHMDQLPARLGLESGAMGLHPRRVRLRAGILGLPAGIPRRHLRARLLPTGGVRAARLLPPPLGDHRQQRPHLRSVRPPGVWHVLLRQLFHPGLCQPGVRVLGHSQADGPTRPHLRLLPPGPRPGMGDRRAGLRPPAGAGQTGDGAPVGAGIGHGSQATACKARRRQCPPGHRRPAGQGGAEKHRPAASEDRYSRIAGGRSPRQAGGGSRQAQHPHSRWQVERRQGQGPSQGRQGHGGEGCGQVQGQPQGSTQGFQALADGKGCGQVQGQPQGTAQGFQAGRG